MNKFNQFIKEKEKLYRSYLEPKSNKFILAAKNKGLFPCRINKEKTLLYLSLIRTEAHRDVLLKILSE